jgi:ABC-2 type transport system permease protein
MTSVRQGVQQAWLVARRELRERLRSKGFAAGTAIMLVVVVAAIAIPALVDTDKVTRDVGFTGTMAAALPAAVTEHGEAVDVTVRVHRYDDLASGEQAVRDDDIDALVVDSRLLEWRDDADERLRSVLTGAIQLAAVQERADAAGITPAQLATLTAPVSVENETLGIAAGRSQDDEAAAHVMAILLLVAIATYGQLVLTGVVQEKSSRVVEVLLARMPAGNLLAGKIAGIGLLGFAQFAITAVAALVATMAVDSIDIPAISGGVLAWVVAWFVLGYIIYATAYGAFGSLASRTEDATSIAAPVTTLLVVGYWASFLAVSSDPEGGWARLVSFVPATAPFAMPARIALGATEWWEPFAAAVLTLAAIALLVAFAARVYRGAILRTGATVKLREAWNWSGAPFAAATPASATPGSAARPARQTTEPAALDRMTNAVLAGIAVAAAGVLYAATRDVIIAVAVGAGAFGLGTRFAKARHHAPH